MESITERFKKFIKTSDSCWEWQGGKDTKSYGVFTIKKKQYKAHRVMYSLSNNIPLRELRHLCVCHTCDNPSCVNPDHLWLGTQQDNMDDMVKKGRAATGVNNASSKLTKEIVREARFLRSRGMAYSEMARIYNISPGAIRKAVLGITWK